MIKVISLVKDSDGRSTAFFSNGEQISLSLEELCAFHIAEDKIFEEDEYSKFYRTLLKERAKTAVMQMVLFSRKTEKQVADKVLANGFDSAVAEDLILELRAGGYINDEDYARKFVKSSLNGKYYSKRQMRAELSKKGIRDEIISQIFDELEPDDFESAKNAIEKKLRITRGRPSYLSLCGFLERKGFTPDVIIRVLREYGIEQ